MKIAFDRYLPESREYKMMLEPLLFQDTETAVSSFTTELRSALALLGTPMSDVSFAEKKTQLIEFIDSEQHELREQGFLLRQRTVFAKKKFIELTLKCRSPDFCLPVALRNSAEQHQAGKVKLEEDIAPTYVSRFSTSITVSAKKSLLDRSGRVTSDRTIEYFPFPGDLQLKEQKLVRVNGVQMYESVLEGPRFQVQKIRPGMALIFWKRAESERLASVEFSYRVPFSESLFEREVAKKLFRIYERLQSLDWFSSKQHTKTAYIYES